MGTLNTGINKLTISYGAIVLFDILFFGLILLLGHQLLLAFTQGRIYGRNNWLSYSMGWIYVKNKPVIFYVTLVNYSLLILLFALFILGVFN